MTTARTADTRDVVPRWRQWRHLRSYSEISPVRIVDKSDLFGDSWFDSAYVDWMRVKAIGTAADAFSAAMVEGIVDDRSLMIAKYLRENSKSISSVLQNLVANFLKKGAAARQSESQKIPLENREVLFREINYLKRRVVLEPRNGLLWHDLAWCYAVVGERAHAERALRVALQVSGDSRFIRRGASRFFVNIKDYSSALRVLTESENLKHDPWLVSAHVAASRTADRDSKHRGLGLQMLRSSSFAPFQISELAAALATEELYRGNRRKIRKLVTQSLVQPTDNTLAQVVWLGGEMQMDFVEPEKFLKSAASFEARARHAYEIQNWKKSVNHTFNWLQDEPFSIDAATLGSFTAATFLEDFDTARKFAQIGLQSNPDNLLLRNNLVVAQCELGDVEAALNNFSKISEPNRNDVMHPTWLATSGLLMYRIGKIDRARELYRFANQRLTRRQDTTDRIIAAYYQAKEEIRLKNNDFAVDILRSTRGVSGVARRDIRAIADKLEKVVKRK